jgi:hypothetical protein
MLTYAFILLVYFTTAAGVETIQATVKATSLERCTSTRNFFMKAAKDTNGWAGICKPLDSPEPIHPEAD